MTEPEWSQMHREEEPWILAGGGLRADGTRYSLFENPATGETKEVPDAPSWLITCSEKCGFADSVK